MTNIPKAAHDAAVEAFTNKPFSQAIDAAILAAFAHIGDPVISAGWRKIDHEAKNYGRCLLLWAAASGFSDHIELGWWSRAEAAWVNTYGHPFSGNAPDAWSPLAPFVAPHSDPVKRKLAEALSAAHQDMELIRERIEDGQVRRAKDTTHFGERQRIDALTAYKAEQVDKEQTNALA